VHVREQAEDFHRLGERFGAHWTPTILEIGPEGREEARVEGFLPADDLIAQLQLGLAHAAFKREQWNEAGSRFSDIVEHFGHTDAAAEADYWMGVSHYKATGEAHFLHDTAERFTHHFQDTTWAKKASVWGSTPH